MPCGNTLQQVPEGKWGYVIVASSFLVAFLVDGIGNSFGVVLPYVSATFQSNMGVTSLAPGLLVGTFLLTGPLTAMLVKRFGCRRVSFVGGFITSIGITVSTQVSSIELFIIFYGVVAGFGIGLIYLPSITMVNIYFDRKRGVMVGLVTAGSGIGLLVMASLIERLTDIYGWRGCYLIMAAIFLHLCACACLMRPVEDNFTSNSVSKNDLDQNSKTYRKCSDDVNLSIGFSNERLVCVHQNRSGILRHSMEIYVSQPAMRKLSYDKSQEKPLKSPVDLAVAPEIDKRFDISTASCVDVDNSTSDDRKSDLHESYEEVAVNGVNSGACHDTVVTSPQLSTFKGYKCSKKGMDQTKPKTDINDIEGEDVEVRLHKSLTNVAHNTSLQSLNIPAEYASLTNLTNPRPSSRSRSKTLNSLTVSLTQFQNGPELSSCELCKSNTTHVGHVENDRMNSLKLFKIIRFDLFCIGAFLIQFAVGIPGIFTPSFALSVGIDPSSAAFIISIMGISDTIGRVIAGLLASLELGTVRIYNTGTFMAGVACYILPSCTSFGSLLAFAVCYGFFNGAFPPLQSVILVEQLGLELLPASFGIMCLFKSVASVAGPTLSGMAFELFGTYSVPFYFAGGILTLSNILHVIMTFCPKQEAGLS